MRLQTSSILSIARGSPPNIESPEISEKEPRQDAGIQQAAIGCIYRKRSASLESASYTREHEVFRQL